MSDPRPETMQAARTLCWEYLRDEFPDGIPRTVIRSVAFCIERVKTWPTVEDEISKHKELDMERAERAYRALIKKHANGRTVCNCGEAYLTNCGTAIVTVDGERKIIHDSPTCKDGCSANQIRAKYEMALYAHWR